MENTVGIESAQSTEANNSRKTVDFEFKGDGLEYFKIWIVNVMLTIVTLGIYSAWAKVRNNQYFHSNTYLENINFRYLAEPLQILKGRIIAIIAFIVYSVIASLDPTLAVAMAVTLLLAMPYFINQSLAFNFRMSAYRNIQFRFSATYLQAFMVLFVWPIIGVLSIGLLYPLALKKMHEYIVGNAKYGTAPFSFKAELKDYYIILLTILGIGLMMGLPAWGIGALVPDLAFMSIAIVAVMYFGIIIYSMVAMYNLFYCSIALQEHQLKAHITMAGMAKVIFLNAFFTLITLGLYIPAAKVRMTRYICSCIELDVAGSLDGFSAAERTKVSALGEEFGEVFDFGL